MHTARYTRRALVLAAALGAPLAAQQKPVEMQPINYGQSAAPDVALRIVGSFAKLRVTTWERDSVSLTGEMPYGADLSGLVSGEPIRIQRTKLNLSGTSSAHTPPAGTLELRVPLRARLEIRGGTAD